MDRRLAATAIPYPVLIARIITMRTLRFWLLSTGLSVVVVACGDASMTNDSAVADSPAVTDTGANLGDSQRPDASQSDAAPTHDVTTGNDGSLPGDDAAGAAM